MNKINRHDGTPTPVSQPGGPPKETNVRPTLSQSISNIIRGGAQSRRVPVLLLTARCWCSQRGRMDHPRTRTAEG